jgi:2-keto-4-pentenoate hydratase/2-oxohepta-3-ene-1,7-dioic acid hydratase in catechol pathway
MKLCRYNDDRVGLVIDGRIHDVTPVLGELPVWRHPLPRHDPLIANLARLRAAMEEEAQRWPPIPVERVVLRSPVANPGKLIAAPVNYRKHLEEVLADRQIHHGNLISEIHRAGLFLKATSALVGAGEGVRLVHTDRRNDHEVEVAVVIGRQGRNIRAADALGHVAGYCIGLDMTIRGPEERSFRKSADSYAVLGPWLVTPDEVPDPAKLRLTIAVNGEVRQDANTEDLVVDIPGLIEMASAFYTLHPGDVIFTGTPQGVGPVQPGDTMVATVERIGSMTVAVSAA